MRADALGLFWEDRPPEPKTKALKVKRTPPEPVWLRPDYLPGLDEALEMPGLEVMTQQEVLMASFTKERMFFDIECYINYFLASFRSVITGKILYFESFNDSPINLDLLRWCVENLTTVGFNSLSYDLPITYLALAGKKNALLKAATNLIILEGWQGYDVLKQYKVKGLKAIDHIDLIEVAPLRASLKIYGGRLHTPRMQDLPFHPDVVLTNEQRAIVRWYNLNSDLTATGFLHECLKEHIDLRTTISNEIGMDVRSKSDAQLAEAVIGEEYIKRTGMRAIKPYIEPGTCYRYRVPHFIKYKSALLNWALGIIQNAYMFVDETGSIALPEEIKSLKLDINGSCYRMGIGGLHSSEKCAVHYTDDEYELIDVDATSFYPFIILVLGLYPKHLGPVFLQIYKSIVDRRIAAKKRGDKVTADSLKITVNGSFGKLGNKYSILYSPDLLIQVTITGQLSLLMLIERLELSGIHVVSANTDGIVIKCPKKGRALFDSIIKQWENDTGFTTEETRYMALYSRDVNNYIAVKQKEVKEKDGSISWIAEKAGTKNKGAFSNPWASKKNMAERLHKNPTNIICIEAVEELLLKDTPIMTTIQACKDITKFISVRSVKGGAVKIWDYLPPPEHQTKEELIKLNGFYEHQEGYWRKSDWHELSIVQTDEAYEIAKTELSKPKNTEYLGKAIRWYYARGVTGEIVYASNGNKVPRSDGAKPLMDLPKQFPDDIDFEWYEQECSKILIDIGYISKN